MIEPLSELSALVEESADEIGRLDELARYMSASYGQMLLLAAVAQLTDPTKASLLALLSSEGDTLHELALTPLAVRWRTLIAEEERRVRGGAFLSVSRFTDVAPALTNYVASDRLEEIWRERSRERPVLIRALDTVAWFPEPNPSERASAGEALAALLLCGGGRTDHLRILPFVSVRGVERAEAILAWRAGDEGPWARLALTAAAQRARQVREALRIARESETNALTTIRAMGRGGINAERAFEVLGRYLVTTMPMLADELGLSRPAAAAALERLAGAGLAREVTGRGRDRVYAYEAALVVGEAALES